MPCSRCGTEGIVGKKFCAECGSPLSNRCSKCNSDNALSAKFCADCGSALSEAADGKPPTAERLGGVRIAPESTSPEALEGERKTVTALFADIKGSTELMEDLDPEEARAIIDPALKLMIEAVSRYDGYVVQSTGDGIFALFGAPVAHEDHPQRALYSALRMQEELKRYSAKMLGEGGTPIQGRVGINTGEVVVRSIQTGASQVEYTPIGHTTNLASRMQTAAPVGSIAVSEATRRLCEGYFTLKPLGPTRVKGVSDQVNVYEVTGLGPLRTRLQRSAGRGLTKFVGREREIEAMKHAAQQAKLGHGQIVAAMAEAGVGKSRLYFEFKATSQSGWMVLETVSISHGKASAYLPVLDLLHGYFKIASGDDERTRREKVAGRITILDRSLEDTLPYLFSLLGIVEGDDPLAQMDGQVRKRRTLEAIKRILLRESLNQPLMVIFEDLHWIDEATQEFLNLLADSLGTAKILLLVNYRPEYSHGWGSKTYYTQLRLDPLGQESAEEMLSALLGDGVELAPLKRVIIEKTEGNPFFMEETVQVMFDEGALVREGTAVRLTRPLGELKIPPTVQGILAARIDRLPADAKELLQTLAVLGRDFPFGLVRSVTLKPDDELNRMLGRLQLAEFIYEQPAIGDVEYIFKHALTLEVAQQALLVERRKLLHARAGAALESRFADQLEDHLDEIAHHYSRSDDNTKAVEFLERAGRQAMQRSAYADAIGSLRAALNLIQKLEGSPETLQRELTLQLAVGLALMALKGRAASEAERAHARALELCALLGEPREFFPALFGLWIVYLLRGDLPRAHDLAKQLQKRAYVTQDPAELTHGEIALGNTWYWIGDFPQARQHLEKAIALLDFHRGRVFPLYGGLNGDVICRSYMALTLWKLGYPEQALKRGNEALELAQRLAHPFTLAFAGFFYSGVLRQIRREPASAQYNAERGMSISRDHGIVDPLAWATTLHGWTTATQGQHEDGITEMQQGLTASRGTGTELLRPYFLSLLGEVCKETGRLDEALAALTEALVTENQNEIRFYEAETHRLKGELLLAQSASNGKQAEKSFISAIEVSRRQHAKSWELRATTSLARLLSKQGKRDEARAMLANIYNWFTEGFDIADLKDAKALLDELNSES